LGKKNPRKRENGFSSKESQPAVERKKKSGLAPAKKSGERKKKKGERRKIEEDVEGEKGRLLCTNP